MNATAPEPARRRLFYAFWPDDALRRSVGLATHGVVAEIRGRGVPPGRLHVTAAFLGSQPETLLPALIAAQEQLTVRPFLLHFDSLDYWVQPRAVVATARANSETAALVRSLWRRLEAVGLRGDARPYRPHVTLMRGASRPPRDAVLKPFDWPVEAVTLVESLSTTSGVHYRPLATARLGC